MKIHEGELQNVTRYLQNKEHVGLKDREAEFESLMKKIRRFKRIDKDAKFLEIGTGIGWFPIICKREGISCKGLEISPQLVEYARSFGRRYGIEPDIDLGNIEDANLDAAQYDVIVAASVFEHVEHWQEGIERVFNALKPGGLFYFYSTNKFSLRSGECTLPCYGWLPDRWRYRLRSGREGGDIMKWGIDFNQFTYSRLRRFFRKTGFSAVLDPVDIYDPDNLYRPTLTKKILLKTLRRFRFLKHLALFFAAGTLYICIK